MSQATPLLQVEELKTYFPLPRGLEFWKQRPVVKAVDGVTFAVEQGTTFGLVGESGCGKTTVAKSLLLLEKPTAGRISFAGQPLTTLSRRDVLSYRQAVQAVFQDPYSSLNPRMRIAQIVTEPITAHQKVKRSELAARAGELLNLVGLHPATAGLFPHELSGGQRQRVAIARALSLNPRLIVLDEPVSALDVSIRAQIINLMENLRRRLNVSYLLIAHDLAIVRHMAHTTAVMYLGKIVEQGPSNDLFQEPLHPYTRALLSAVPVPDPDIRPERIKLEGEISSALNPPSGCSFHPRCPVAIDRCRVESPELVEISPGRLARCHLVTPAGDRVPVAASWSAL